MVILLVPFLINYVGKKSATVAACEAVVMALQAELVACHSYTNELRALNRGQLLLGATIPHYRGHPFIFALNQIPQYFGNTVILSEYMNQVFEWS